MASTEAISSQTAAATSADITLGTGEAIQIWAYPTLADGETVKVYRNAGSGADEIQLLEGGQEIRIDDEQHFILVNGPAILRVKKSITATATKVYYDV